MNERVSIWVSEELGGWMDACVDGWVGGWMDRRTASSRGGCGGSCHTHSIQMLLLWFHWECKEQTAGFLHLEFLLKSKATKEGSPMNHLVRFWICGIPVSSRWPQRGGVVFTVPPEGAVTKPVVNYYLMEPQKNSGNGWISPVIPVVQMRKGIRKLQIHTACERQSQF